MNVQTKDFSMGRGFWILLLGLTLTAFFALTAGFGGLRVASAATAGEINRDVNGALNTLYRTTPAAKKMAGVAKGILVFPQIIEGGLLVGGQYGEGALRVGGKTTGYYRSFAVSYGLQAGAQAFGYALFFLSNDDLKYLKKSDGWELGVEPQIVVMDKGLAGSFSTTTFKPGIYAFFFNQKGLMAGISIQGGKITEFKPGR
jgi:lipid-binding SYLF domain-containing protein